MNHTEYFWLGFFVCYVIFFLTSIGLLILACVKDIIKVRQDGTSNK